MTILAEHVVNQIIEMSQGKRIHNKKKREAQLEKLVAIVNGFIKRNPKYQ